MLLPTSPDELRSALAGVGYLAGDDLSVALHLALTLDQPLLLEGAAGVGKTEAARATASALGRPLIRLQCYEGIEREQALYEWDYPRQLLSLRDAAGVEKRAADVYSWDYLIARPLLTAVLSEEPVVLLIDEVDRADEAFEAFMLELLSDFQITIPEIGTVTAASRPLVVLTSNRTRELHDALRRRCLYQWIGFPSEEVEARIIALKAEGADAALATRISAAVAELRDLGLYKPPGVGESVSWARALIALGTDDLSAGTSAALKVLEDTEDPRVHEVLGRS